MNASVFDFCNVIFINYYFKLSEAGVAHAGYLRETEGYGRRTLSLKMLRSRTDGKLEGIRTEKGTEKPGDRQMPKSPSREGWHDIPAGLLSLTKTIAITHFPFPRVRVCAHVRKKETQEFLRNKV